MLERVSARLVEAGASVGRWWRTGYGAVSRAVRGAGAWLKPRVNALLERLEKVLLNAKWRERIHAGATFALIVAFAAASVDFLVAGGGFDFGARAAEPPSAVHASLNAAMERNRGAARRAPATHAAQTGQAQAAEPLPAVLSPALAQVSQASVIEISHRLDAPLEPEATSRTPRTRLAVAPLVAEGAELRGAGAQAGDESLLDGLQRSKPADETGKRNG